MHNTSPYLVINSNQTGIHLIQSARRRTLNVKGLKDVKIIGLEDKKQIICIISSNALGELLPSQLVCTCTTNRSLLKYTEAKTRCLE